MRLTSLVSATLVSAGLALSTLAMSAPGAMSSAVNNPGAGMGAPFGGAPKTVSVDIVANRTAGTPRSDYQIGIRLKHEPGWHTYWRFAGDTGFAPEVEWNLPRRWTAEPLGWPLPQKHRTGTLTNFVYSDEVLLPYKLDIPWGTPYGTSATIRAKVSWLACKDICIPGEAEVRFRVPIEVASKPSAEAKLFEDTKKNIPELVSSEHITATLEEDRIRLDFAPLAGKIDKKVEFFLFEGGMIDFKSLDKMHREGDTTSLYLKAAKPYLDDNAQNKTIAPLDGVIVADDGPLKGGWAIRAQIPVTAGSVPLPWVQEPEPEKPAPVIETAAPVVEKLTQGTAIVFAFLGGLILNLMPCVFPVLSLKILQLVDSSRRTGSLPAHGFAFTGGVILSMALLAGALMLLRHLGWAIGWGFQLQTPWVVAILALLFFSLSLNLWGLFEFTAASHLADSRAVKKLPTTGPAGSFFTGVLAVVVASPCTAPFMGAALGYAVMQSDMQSLLVFVALGFGMSLPWLLLTLVPAWTKFLPKPGAWMVTFKRVMAVPMACATLWLIWVLSRQVSVYGLLTVIFATGSVAAFLWAVGREQYGRGKAQVLKLVTGIVTLVCVALLALGTFDRKVVQTSEGPWQAWSEEAVTQALAEGHPVVVDFTAAWCVTCQFNKATAIRTSASEALMNELNYVRFEADWTNRDARITEVLNRFGRTGVPLYLLYKPDGTTTVLPELLTEASFMEALKTNVEK